MTRRRHEDDEQIRFNCSACGKRLKAPRAAAGRAATCRRCGKALTVPDGPAAAAVGVGLADAPAARHYDDDRPRAGRPRDDDDRPRRRRRDDDDGKVRPPRRRLPNWVAVAIIIPALLASGMAWSWAEKAVFGRGMPVEAYKVQRPAEPTWVVGNAYLHDEKGRLPSRSGLSNYHELYLPGGVITAWVPKDAAVGRRLYEALKDGQRHSVQLLVKPFPDKPGDVLVEDGKALIDW
jgi:hypothetical protein